MFSKFTDRKEEAKRFNSLSIIIIISVIYSVPIKNNNLIAINRKFKNINVKIKRAYYIKRVITFKEPDYN